MSKLRAAQLVVSLAVVCLVAGPSRAEPCATDEGDRFESEVGNDLDIQGAGFEDPFERLNRGTLKLNQTVDRWVLAPATSAYRFVVPDLGRRALRNFMENLNTPVVLVNDLLQAEFHDAAVTMARFMVNSTMGVGGLIDVGIAFGMPNHPSDFGQTMARAGVGSGPYLMLPVLGPTTLRDGTGYVIDFLLRPTSYVLVGFDQVATLTTIQTGSAGLAEWDANSDALRRLNESSIDFYAALRSAYYQHRMAEIHSRDEESGESESSQPVYSSWGSLAGG